MSDLTKQGIQAFKEGKKKQALRFLSQAIRKDPQDEAAWFALGACVSTREQRIDCLQKVLEINPKNEAAGRELNKIMPPQKKRQNRNVIKILAAVVGSLVLLSGVLAAGIKFVNQQHQNGPQIVAQKAETEQAENAAASLSPASPSETVPPTSTSFPTETALVLEKTNPVTRSFTFEYNCDQYTITLPLYESVNDYFSSKKKTFYYSADFGGDPEKEFYENFILTDNDYETIDYVIQTVEDELDLKNEDELVVALTSLVQNITYDCDKLFSYVNLDDHGYETNFPYETLYTKRGVCGDLSILLVKILQHLKFGAAFLVYENTNHMAVGIQCPRQYANYIKDGTGYCYIESTASQRIGVKPEQFDGKEFNEKPRILVVARGKTFEGMNSLGQNQQAEAAQYDEYILHLSTCEEISSYKQIQTQEASLDNYKNELSELQIQIQDQGDLLEYEIARFDAMGCEGTVSQEKYDQCVNQQHYLEGLQQEYNQLVGTYNDLLAEYRDFYNQYVQTFNSFNELRQRNNQGCANVSAGTITMEEDSN